MNYFYLHDGRIVRSLRELSHLLPTMDDSLFLFHVNPDKNDFASWIAGVFGNKALADSIKTSSKDEMGKKISKFLEGQPETILVLNAGSSSLKFELIDVRRKHVLIRGNVDGIGLDTCKITEEIEGKKSEERKEVKSHDDAVALVLSIIEKISPLSEIKGIGHRVVHGGEYFHSAALLDDDAIRKIDELSLLAPLHNPPNLKGILACRKAMPDKPEVAVFDTAFHSTIPKESYLYGIPIEYYEKYGIRKYGFHGTSHNYVFRQACALAKKDLKKVITCHLGNGDSITAIQDGRSIETSMGLTPLQGLIMGTRSGDIDPEIVAFLSEKENLKPRDVINILNKKSGLLGISGYSDMRTIHEHIGEEKAKLAFDMAVHRLIHYIGGYAALMDGVEGIVFTAGIGEGAYYLREAVCSKLSHIGVKLDSRKNKKGEMIVSAKNSKVKVMVIPTNEELEIAMQTSDILNKK